MTLPLLPHRIPGHPDHHYLVASGGYWVHGPAGFVTLCATRRDLDLFVAGLGGCPPTGDLGEQVTPGALLTLLDAMSTVLAAAPALVAGDPDVRAAAVALAEQITRLT